MAAVTIKQHDTKVTFTDVPKIDGVTVTSGDLAGCTVSFILKSATVSIKAPAVITAGGTFSYDPVPADVAVIGDYQQEWEVVYPSTKILTFPNGDYNKVTIIADLG
jgi:hypothetical protein